ncbi:MAG TPA: hypothetical protein DHW39_01930 [Erysipelotrichaceae bacterium]|jgi:hypothetical protein|nr:hypothetical protein [Erysipelotrichaceae bacterium]
MAKYEFFSKAPEFDNEWDKFRYYMKDVLHEDVKDAEEAMALMISLGDLVADVSGYQRPESECDPARMS